MTEVHQRLHRLDQLAQTAQAELAEGEVGEGVVDPIKQVAEEMSGGIDEVHVLCFDEFQCNDIFTAVTLSRLLTHLLENSTILVSTSNRPPRDLNARLLSGPQAEEFEVFLGHLAKSCEPWAMDSGIDYRRSTLEAGDLTPTYLHGPGSDERLEEEFARRCKACSSAVVPREIPVAFGRTLHLTLTLTLTLTLIGREDSPRP